MMDPLTREGIAKIIPTCTYPLTGVGCVRPGPHRPGRLPPGRGEVVLRGLFGLDLGELRKLVPVSLADGSRTSRRGIKMSVRLASPRRIFCRICLPARNVRV
jgi:hypothetical protein